MSYDIVTSPSGRIRRRGGLVCILNALSCRLVVVSRPVAGALTSLISRDPLAVATPSARSVTFPTRGMPQERLHPPVHSVGV